MRRKLKVVVTGCGFIARQVHLPLLTHFRDIEVAAVCDTEREKATKMANDFGVPRVYTDVETMLQEQSPDLVDICTPPATHVDILRQTLNDNYPCMVEKPLTTATKDADEIIRLSQEKDLGVYVLHTYSYLPSMRRAKQRVANGDIGKLVSVQTCYFTSLERERYAHTSHWIHTLPGGVLNSEITPHLLMLLLDFLDDVSDVKVFTHKLSSLPYVVADELRMTLVSHCGIGSLSLSFNSPTLYHSFDLVGDRGCLFIDNVSQTTVYHRAPDYIPNIKFTRDAFSRGRWALSDISQRLSSFSASALNTILRRYVLAGEGHRFLMKECFHSLRSKSQYPVDLHKCREVVKLVETIASTVDNNAR